MVIKCTFNTIEGISDPTVKTRLLRSIHIDGDLTDLTVDGAYTVLAIEQRDGGIWVFINTVPEGKYPYPYPLELFDVTEFSIPEGWCIKFSQGEGGLIIKRISFPEWANDELFYEKLVDEDPLVLAIYRQKCMAYSEQFE